MGRFGGRGGRGGGRGGRGGRGVPFKPGPKLGRAVEDELAARDEDDDTDDRRSGWDEMGGAPRRKKSVLDRKTMRKRAKEDKAAQRRAWATRHQKKEPGDGSGGGGGGEASGKRGGSKKRRGGAADEEGDDPRYVRDDRERGGGGAKRRRRDDGDDDEEEDDDARKGRREKKDPNKPVTLTAEQRMGRSAYEAYKRDEAEQRRLMKKLKGRKGQEDDGMGFFFDSLPGMEILEAGDEDRRRESLSAETKKAAASFGDKLAKLRRRDAMESDDDDDDDDLDDDDDDLDDDTAGEKNAGRDGTAGDGGVVNFDELDDALEAAFADDSDDDDDDDDDDEDDDDAYEDDDDEEDDEGEEDEGEEESEPKADPTTSSAAPSGKYVPPAQRAAAAAATTRASGKSESEAKAAAALEDARRRVRGLMNRMGESNVANIAGEIAGIARDVPRRAVGDACTAEILKALVDGPRASEQYAAALAAFVAGVSGELGPELAARFGRETLKSLDAARTAGNARAASNLCAVFARLHTCGLYPSRVVYGLLTKLVSALDELDAALMLSLLRCAGPRLRSEDPAGMRDFIASLQTRVAELREKSKEGDEDGDGRGGGLTKRARLMLDMVVDLKNNKRVVGAGAGGAGGAEGGDQWGFPAALAKWLRASHAVGDAAVALRALTHERLVDEGRWNVGQWWLPDATGTEAWFAARAAQERSDSAAKNAAATNDEGAELLAKAKGLRMNTEARRAIFCVIMGAEDFADALDRLLGLPLADKQEREIPRVLIECCLQEKAYNPYYETLATRLCERVRSHRLTLQLCVWDQIREIAPTRRNLDGFNRDAAGANDKPKVSVRRIANLARFTAGLLVSGALAPTAIKVIDFGGGLDSDERARLHHRLLLQAILSAPANKRGEVHVVFQGVARGGSGRGSGEMGALRASLGQALSSGELLEGLPKGDVATPGTVKYVKKAAREALNILQGMLA